MNTTLFIIYNRQIMQYLKNSDLKVIKPDWRGNPFYKGEFRYLVTPFRPNYGKIMKWMLTPNPQRQEKKADKWLPKVIDDKSYLQSQEDYIVWLGHATFLIQVNGVRIITDPNFMDTFYMPRKVMPPYPISEIKGIDYILLSHDHRDHCDKNTLQTVLKNNRPQILTSLRMTNVIGSWVKDTPIQEAGWFQQYQTAEGIKITYLPAQHWCRRGLIDLNQQLWGSFMIEANGKTIYFGGDSAEGTHFEEIGKLFPNIDIAILGIGAYCPDYIMQDNHANPAEATEAFLQLGAKEMIPMHYGTYDLSDEPISEPYRWIQNEFGQQKMRERLKLLGVSESYYLK